MNPLSQFVSGSTLRDFFTEEAGQQRRAWLERQGQAIGDAAQYYLGPTGIPTRIGAAAELLNFTDAADVVAAGEASQALWNDPSVANAANYAAAGAALALPFYSARMGEGLASAADDAVRYFVDEDGAIRLMGGGESDPTLTGWTFRDVQSPNRLLSASDNRRIAGQVGVRETVLPIRSMYATQPTVNADFATTESSAGELPLVIRKGGALFVQDGHHRLTRAAEEGAQNARVRFIDLDGEDAAAPLLDWSPQKSDSLIADDDVLLNGLFGDDRNAMQAYLDGL